MESFKKDDWIKAIKKSGRLVVITGKITKTFENSYEVEMPDGIKMHVRHSDFDVYALEKVGFERTGRMRKYW